ncbi:hypothetical protein AVL62_13910 [Serinicoccus chungangensis]|uniref:Uncharacterized protein n=1 Tax=Serinicoccus chungangensis TaxID=767452 RepID=A0A0W8I3F8_9MICO|nr:hypothetical protein [Serinicoccus chungangensis]KUG52427.1 hypothetical protein AVL62_13910 [Serinicoccus chungangensis]
MSYDITLCPRHPGQDWADALAAADAEDAATEADEQALATGVETFRRIEARLREVVDGEVETWVAEETGGDVYGELRALDTGLQVELFDRSASVTVAEDAPGDPGTLEAQVRGAVEAVRQETGYEAYDHHRGETFDGTPVAADDTATMGTAGAADPAEGPATGAETGGPGRRAAADAARRNPASLRRRGWIYLVLGIVITILAIQRLGSGDTGALTIVLLVIGVLDLLGGALLVAVAQRPAADEPTTH